MIEKELRTRMIQKHDIEVNWEKAINFIPKKGELIVYDPDENYNYSRVKIGDGISTASELHFIIAVDTSLTQSGQAADAKAVGDRLRSLSEKILTQESDPTVPAWAKQPTKPTYTASEVGALPDTYTLPIATETTLGGVKAAAATEEMTQPVGITAEGKLVTVPGQNSGGNVDYVGVEPAEDDIPKIFFGGALQQTKKEAVVPFRYISKTDDFSGYAEIKAQGNSSMSYPKKNQTVKMFSDESCDSKMKKDFKSWGNQNKHVYKANWIDLSHARNVVSARLWADVVKSRADYESLPELLRTSPNQGAVDGFPVKVYAAGVYQGRYTLNIPKDAWMANMNKDLDIHCILCGENYVSGCFRAAANINESDWTDEIHDVVPASIKTRWNEVISFVMNSTDEEFRENLSKYFYVDSLIDYYLFGLSSCGLDAFGKNQLYMTYDGQKWIATMYDMDSTWGLWWNGSSFVATDYDRSEYQDFKDGEGNLLYIRLENLFYEELKARWAELRNGALSIENIINRFERFTDIVPAELVKEDYASTTGGGKFTGIPSQTTNNIQQIRAFALARRAWTDEYVASLTQEVEVPCTGISLNTNTLTFTTEGSQTLTATVTPDGCTDPVTWESDNANVVTVNGGVVTAIANGSATITAKCGEYSASCSVLVSGIELSEPYYSWSDENIYEINADGTVTETSDKYITNLFDVPYGSYRIVNNTGKQVWGYLAQYDSDGNFVARVGFEGLANGKRSDWISVCEDLPSKLRIAAHIKDGIVLERSDGIWSEIACYGAPKTGAIQYLYNKQQSSFMTQKKIAVEGGKTYTLANKNGGGFGYKGVAEYKADGSFVKFEQQGGFTTPYTTTLDAETAYVYLIAGLGTDPNNCLEFTMVE